MSQDNTFTQQSRLSAAKRALLARRLRGELVATSAPGGIPCRSQDGPAPLSFAQQRLWFLDQLEPGSPFYNVTEILRLKGQLDVVALRQSLNEIVRRHEVLRTTFALVEGQPAQIVSPTLHLPLPEIDLQGLSMSPSEAEGVRLATQETRRPFDLARGPLVRATLLRLAGTEHMLLLSMHHITADGWSVAVFVRELTTLYTAFRAGKPSPLPELPIQYADYALWQRQRLQGRSENGRPAIEKQSKSHGEMERVAGETLLDVQLAYWKRQLAGAPALLDLPTDRLRPVVQTFRGTRQLFLLPEALTERLRELSKRAGVTLFMTLLAAFQILLCRYSGQDDIVVGTPIANRTSDEVEGLIGFFVNTLLLRTDLSDSPTVWALLERVREVTLQAYAHQDLPFEQLVEALQPRRNLNRNPLFQVMFFLQNAPAGVLELPGLTLSSMQIESETVKFDLTLVLAEDKEGLKGALGYNTDLFEGETIQRLIGCLQTLLEAIVADPEQPIRRLPLLSTAERHRLLCAWNPPPVPLPGPRCLPQRVADQARRTPDALALVQEGTALSYQELDERANQLAHALRARGVGPERVVGLCLERSLDLVIGLLGILKAGGVLLPLAPTAPRARLALLLAEAWAGGEAGVVLTQRRLVEHLPLRHEEVLCLDADWGEVAGESRAAPVSGISGEYLAYVLYTSGSTGEPKGVQVTHAALSNRLGWQQESRPLVASDRVLQIAAVSFDIALWELLGPLQAGAQVVLARVGGERESGYLVQVLRRERITVAHFVPSLLQVVLEEEGVEELEAWRWVLCGGERVPAELIGRFGQRSAAEFEQLYGPTESAISVTSAMCGEEEGVGGVPLGQGIANVQLYVLDEEGEPVPVGVRGEIYIGGAGLARGYVGRGDLTAERFVPDRYGGEEEQGRRLYRTGDRGRYRADGRLEYVGRLDEQVKIRGYRVEPGEVAAVLNQHSEVQEAVVLARDEKGGGRGKQLVAYVVAEQSGGLRVRELRRYLQERVPDYLIPAEFVLLEQMPRTVQGKVDRQALLALGGSPAEWEQTFVRPRTALEELLAGLWEDLLARERVGIHDNFFELGGDSIKAAIFINRLQAKFGVLIYVVALFDAPTIAELAVYLGTHYPGMVASLFGTASLNASPGTNVQEVHEQNTRIDAKKVAQIRALIPPLPLPGEADCTLEAKNAPAIFVLSPPRSGSTLLRVILAGHPKLFAPPELELLSFNTLIERRDTFSGRDRFWLEGTLRALMEIKSCDVEVARTMMAEYEEQRLTTRKFYRLMQEWLGQNILVDKTPAYALDIEILKRAEQDFADARYIHLVRHPYGAISSFEEAKLSQVFFRHRHPFTTRELAELIWLISHQNIIEFLQTIPEQRQHRVSFEALVKEPQAVVEGICQFLSLELHPAMLQPYQGSRMTDGIHALSKMVGDVKFHEHKSIDSLVADRWQERYAGDFLGDITWQMAEFLGYKRLSSVVGGIVTTHQALDPISTRPRAAGLELPLSFAQQRLWFLDQLTPGSTTYTISGALRLTGILKVTALERSLNEIIRRHEALRTTFITRDGRPFQVIAPSVWYVLCIADIEALPDSEREAEVQRLTREEVRLPFSLERGPLVRTRLLRLSGQEYVLLLSMHHIVSDGWSMALFVNELTVLYAAFTRDVGEQLSPLPALPIQYADFAAWQREWLRGEVLDTQLAYWRRQLAGAPEVLELPTDWTRPVVQTFRGAHLPLALAQDLLHELRALSQKENVTLFMTLLAAFQVLLYRYTDQVDIIVGTPTAGRTRPEIEGLIGFFVNTLALRTNLSGDPTFCELLERVREVTLGAYAHQDLPFEKLVESSAGMAMQTNRDLSHTPIFQVMFALQNAPTQSLELSDLALRPVRVESGTAKFDLTLSLAESERGLLGELEYNVDLFEETTVAHMLDHFRVLLGSIVANPRQSIAALPLLTPAERLLLATPTPAGSPVAACLHDLFAAQSTRTPQAIALTSGQTVLTYQQLNTRANQLAHYLQSRGVGPETLVGLCLDCSPELVVALLAVLKAGGAYVPLDPTYPPERLAFMLADACISLLITHSDVFARLPASSVEPVFVDSAWVHGRLDMSAQHEWVSILAQQPVSDPVSRAVPANAAYVIYTSGSTGTPKGVVVSHANVARLFASTTAFFHFTARDVWTLFHSVAFDFSVWELWGALLHGGRLVLVPYHISRTPRAFYKLLAREGVTVLNQTPSAFSQLQAVEEMESVQELAVRLVIFGGEALDLGSLQPWLARYGEQEAALVNMYGITETTVHVTARFLSAADIQAAQGSRIGEPLPDLHAYVLDTLLEPVPMGVPGELYIAGAGLARGYLLRQEVTAERFLPHPFSQEPGARMYRTGDVVRWRGKGDLEYLGRADQQVKVRGFRIELGEVEAALASHPAIQTCVVKALGDTGAQRRLVGYVVWRSEQTATIGDLRRYLQARLPEYMVPALFVELAALPQTPSGKVDRRALPEPETDRPDLEQAYIAPLTPVEEALAGIWAHVLGIDQVGIQDNFFALGGDSIRSVQIVALAEQRGLRFSLQQLFQYQTIGELARELQVEEGKSAERLRSQPFSLVSADDRLKLPPDLEDAYPLTRLQAGMLFHSAYMPDTAVYHNITSIHLQAPFDLYKLETTIEHLLARHGVLRTSFDLSTCSQPLQLVHTRVAVPLRWEDLGHLSYAEQESVLAAWIESEKSQAFNWTRAPLLRFHIHRRSAATFQLTMTEHHAILDGWSVASLLTELCQHYLSLLEDEASASVAPPATLFRDFVVLEQEALNSEETRHYWARRLSDSAISMLPSWGNLPDVAPPRARTLDILISAETSEGLKRLARAAVVPVKSVLLAAHLRVMSLLGGQADVLTGLVSNGRPETLAGEQILGLFLNTLPYRQELAGGTWLDLVRQTFATEWELLPYRRYPLVEIQRLHGGEALFESVFNFAYFHVYERLKGLHTLQILGGTGFARTNFGLVAHFSLDIATARIQARLECNDTQLADEQLQTIGDFYTRTLTAMARTPADHYETTTVLSEQGQQRILRDWNATSVEYDRVDCLHELCEAQVERTPDAIAVAYADEQLTYSELNRRANRLAHHLRALGVRPETCVGICMERSSELVSGILGILKAGGAYLPLDPSYPRERLAFMLANARVSILLTRESINSRLALGEIFEDGMALPVEDQSTLGSSLCVLIVERDPGADSASTNLARGGQAENLAYVMYTSGSTGQPKGVMISHRGICNRIQWMQETCRLTGADRVLQKTPFSFDVSLWEFFWPLATGAALVLARPEGHRDSAYLAELIAEQQITTMHFVPSMLRMFLDEQTLEASRHLRQVICSGEALPFELQERFFARFASTRLWNLYGPTEASVDVTSWECERAGQRQVVPIGRPIANTQIYIFDRWLQPVPVGVPGELYIGGVGLARGYCERPDLTAAHFIPHPFGGEPGARLYRTGDLARLVPDRSTRGESRTGDESYAIEFLGRLDHQVKIRGYRIELEEIESLLRQHPAVRDAVVVARAERVEGLLEAVREDRLVVYVVLHEQQPAPAAYELRRYLQARLPDHMVPATFTFIATLPLTPSGKVDRRALPEPDRSRPELEAAYVAPRTPVEEILATIWGQVLDLDRVGVYDSFFTLGGDSIRSIQVRARALELGINFSLQHLFQHQTIAALVQYVETGVIGTVEQAQPFSLVAQEDRANLPADVIDAYPLTLLQRGMLFHSEYRPESAIYHDIFSYHLRAPLDRRCLQFALEQLVTRHPVLRTSFDLSTFSQPLQLVHQTAVIPLQWGDLRHLVSAQQQAELSAWIETEKDRGIDWRHTPLLRFQVHMRSDETFQLTLSFHHAILDGWSVASLLVELLRLYLSLLGGEESASALAPVTVFRDFVALEQEALNSAACRSYWTQQLSDSPLTLLPRWRMDRERAHRTAAHSVPLSAEVSTGLKRLARSASVPLKSVLLAAHLSVLGLLSGETDVVTGLISNGRPEARGAEHGLGLFLNTLPFRLKLAGGTWIDLVRQTFAAEYELLPFRWYPMAQMQRDLNRQQLFEAAFDFVHFHVFQELREFKDLRPLDGTFFEETNFTFLASFTQESSSSRVLLDLNYDAAELCEAQIEAIGRYYAATLAEMSDQPGAHYERYTPLSPQERRLALEEWNATQVEYPGEICIQHLFEAQAARAPDALAVSCAGKQLTYGALNARANLLARYLRTQGVGPEILVGISMERSIEMVVGLLGVLKAGGAYVPLDPLIPPDRLAFLLEDARPALLLTQRQSGEHVPLQSGRVVPLDDYWEYIVRVARETCPTGGEKNSASGAQAENAAYAIYTSGSTGTPKGVLVSQRSLVNHALAVAQQYGLYPLDRVLQFAAPSFDVAAEEIFPSWLSGACVVIWPDQVPPTPPDFSHFLEQEGLSVLNLPIAYWQAWVDELTRTSAALPSSLRLVIAGSEQAQPETLARWQHLAGQAVQWSHAYGTTETTITTTLYAPENLHEPHELSCIPIGRPLANMRVYVLDLQLRPVPVGVPGELYIGGAGLARGYIRHPELTAERFIPDPFSAEPGSRLYRSGDIVRYLPDEYAEKYALECLGRRDAQVKIRGFRIELGEIEATLLRHSAVREAVVALYESAPGSKYLVAYVVVSHDPVAIAHPVSEPSSAHVQEQPLPRTLRRYLEEHLPAYMVPSAFLLLDALPLLPNGKVDRRRLLTLDRGKAENESAYIAPRTPVEETLASIWMELLQLERVGVQDNFFALGGHSLVAIQVVARVRDAFQVELPLRTLFEIPALAELAQAVTGLKGVGPGIQAAAIERVARETHRVRRSALKKGGAGPRAGKEQEGS